MEEKFITRDYPSTRDLPSTRDYPSTGPKNGFREPEPPKKQSAFIRFLKFVFVKDLAIKAAAVLTSVAMFVLMAGLS